MKFKIRVDAGNNMGLGHLIRCMSVSEIIKNNGVDVHFFLKDVTDPIRRMLDKSDFRFTEITADEDFLYAIDSNDRVILDGYHFSSDYEKAIKNRVEKIIAIDDLHNRHFYADSIINHTPGVSPSEYKAEPYTKVFAGLGYCLLRPEILRSIRGKKVPETLTSVFLCLGGEDPKNETFRLLQLILGHRPDVTVYTVVGPAYKHTEMLTDFGLRNQQVKLQVNLCVNDMIALIKRADAAVVSASTIALECLYLQIPLYVVKTADNQNTNFDYLQKYNLAWSFSKFGAYSTQEATELMKNQAGCFSDDITSNLYSILFN
jgi:UDP-2,4-diacetamido-2,4,6-trideoxy-beta-L-altropyranose hydrolase